MFNQYIWELYKESTDGKEKIDYYSTLTVEIYESNNPIEPLIFINEESWDDFDTNRIEFNLIEIIREYSSSFNIDSIEKASELFNKIVLDGIELVYPDKNQNLTIISYFKEKYCYDYIDLVSFGLYFAHPEYFIPYLVNLTRHDYNKYCHFYDIEELCHYFGIPLPTLPKKRDKTQRALYYSLINQTFYEFRKKHGLTPGEMCAFLYDFSLKVTSDNIDKELPPPSKVWLITTRHPEDFDYLDSATEESKSRWTGHIDTRNGDILVMYCLSPRAYIHSIWRAFHDCFVDPFYEYHYVIGICSPIQTEQIAFRELANDPILSQNPRIKARLQGVSCMPLETKEYYAILNILKTKGQNISVLPHIEAITYSENILLGNERDVENQLVEPLLIRLGYSESDWIRQMPVRMGRSDCYYPDYAIGAEAKRGEESAQMVLEAKHQIATKKELEYAYDQARSYALRLQSKVCILASKEGIWIYANKDGTFSKDNFIHKNWDELSKPDIFHEIMLLIGKKKIFSKSSNWL